MEKEYNFYITLKSYENMVYPVHTADRPYIPPRPPMVGYPNIEIISASQRHRITSLLISFITHSLLVCLLFFLYSFVGSSCVLLSLLLSLPRASVSFYCPAVPFPSDSRVHLAIQPAQHHLLVVLYCFI